MIIVETPQFLLQAGISLNKAISITQPRRVAAISLARRVAQEVQEVGTELGQKVGKNFTILYLNNTSSFLYL